MKNITFFSIMICVSFILGTVGCEKADIQKSLPNDQVKIQNRDVPDDCEDCPVTDCCCGVELLSGQNATFWLCGTSVPTTSIDCGPTQPGTCYQIQGYILPFLVTSTDQFKYFCMSEDNSFYIQNRNPSGGSTTIRITCQAGQLGPQSVDVELAPGNTAYYTVNDECEVHACN
jgi:hypothetical protein